MQVTNDTASPPPLEFRLLKQYGAPEATVQVLTSRFRTFPDWVRAPVHVLSWSLHWLPDVKLRSLAADWLEVNYHLDSDDEDRMWAADVLAYLDGAVDVVSDDPRKQSALRDVGRVALRVVIGNRQEAERALLALLGLTCRRRPEMANVMIGELTGLVATEAVSWLPMGDA